MSESVSYTVPSLEPSPANVALWSNAPVGVTLHAHDARRATVVRLARVHLWLLRIFIQAHGINRKAYHLRQGFALLLILEHI